MDEYSLLVNLVNNLYYKKESLSFELFTGIDKACVIKLLKSQKLFLQAWPLIRDSIPDNVIVEQGDIEYSSMKKKIEKYSAALRELFHQFELSTIPIVVIKGIAQSQYVAQNKYSRQFGDIDLLTTEKYMHVADGILRNLGYTQINHYINNQPLQKAFLKEPYSHEFYPYQKNVDGEIIEVEIARFCHGFNSRDCEQMLDRKVQLSMGDYNVDVLSAEDMFVQNIGNVFWNCGIYYTIKNGGTILGDYLDLLLLIQKLKYSANTIVDIIKKHHIEQLAALVFANLYNVFNEEKWIASVIKELDTKLVDRTPLNFFQYQLLNPERAREIGILQYRRSIYSLDNSYFRRMIRDYKTEKFTYEKKEHEIDYTVEKEDDYLNVVMRIPKDLLDIDSFLFIVSLYNNSTDSINEKSNATFYNVGNRMYGCIATDKNLKTAYFLNDGIELYVESCVSNTLQYSMKLSLKEHQFCKSDIIAASLTISVRKDEYIYHEVFMNYELKYGYAINIPLFIMDTKGV